MSRHLRMAFVLLLILVTIQHSSTIRPCCPGENTLINYQRCSDGSSMKALMCPFYETHYDVMTADEQSNLTTDQFCVTKWNELGWDDDFYLICRDFELGRTILEVYAVLELISVFFILLTVFVYFHVRDLLDLQGICILHSISGLALSFLAMATKEMVPYILRRKFGVFLTYFSCFTRLYWFFWFNVLSFDIWRTIAKPKIFDKNKFLTYIYHGFGCGGPLVFLGIIIIANSTIDLLSDLHPGIDEITLGFKSTKTSFLYYKGPMIVLLCSNIIYYCWSCIVLRRRSTAIDRKTVLKSQLMLCVKLFSTQNISWFFVIVTTVITVDWMNTPPAIMLYIWWVTMGLYTLQGIPIFLILVIFRKRVRRGLAGKSLCRVRLPARWRLLKDDECGGVEEAHEMHPVR